MSLAQAESKFNKKVAVRYQLYNSLFSTLPYTDLSKVEGLIHLFSSDAKDKLSNGLSPTEVIHQFLDAIEPENRTEILFKILQVIEREVVLFDAVEDAAFSSLHKTSDLGTLESLINRVDEEGVYDKLTKHLESYRVRIVLTAHPTQFYPDPVLGIMRELSDAIARDDLEEIRTLFLQLGMTRFKNREKPTPIVEARSILWYLENNFYNVIPKIREKLIKESGYISSNNDLSNMLEIGFWPGGDRDGNPFVTAETTRSVATELKDAVLRKYRADLFVLMRRLTFDGVLQKLQVITDKIENTLAECRGLDLNGEFYKNATDFEADLIDIIEDINNNHKGLFVEKAEELLGKVKLFGFHFAIIDIRQDSSVHFEVCADAVKALANKGLIPQDIADNWESAESRIPLIKRILEIDIADKVETIFDEVSDITKETINTYIAVKDIRKQNGSRAIHRSIISNTQTEENLFEVMLLNHISVGTSDETMLDIVPLFETIEDLKIAPTVMTNLYRDPIYGAYLKKCSNEQQIMLGYSDGTKDGGYLGANLGIYNAKRELTEVSRAEDVHVTFFDGRGGPPARGGGNTHRFYRSLGEDISHDHIQLTIQGQTISSNFGTLDSAHYNLEQIFTAGLESFLFHEKEGIIADSDMALLEDLSQKAFDKYQALKNDDLFVSYLDEMTPLRYYDRLNVGSRPTKRKKSSISFSDLRAIPFVGSWSQIKQNVPGYYGLGTALLTIREDDKKWQQIKRIYKENLFFQTLMDNAMQSLAKTFFPLTAYLKDHPKYSEFWKTLSSEAELSIKMLCEVADVEQLLEDDPINRSSIAFREKIILPLLVIQQYALEQIQKEESGEISLSDEEREVFVKLVVKSLAANINASRNSA